MTSIPKPAIGFIGLGLMGSSMVQRLQSFDYSLTVIAHRKREAIDAAVARGASEVKTPGELAEASDIVGGDLVEVSPPYAPSGNTALTGATLLYEMLCVLPGVR